MKRDHALEVAGIALAACIPLLSCSLSATGATLYVDLNNPAPEFPYTNWTTAATNIQDAVDAADAGDQIMVNDGVYDSGLRLVPGTLTTNRLVVDKAVRVRSVNGPAVTSIRGQQAPGGGTGAAAVRCVYLGDGALLAGFTLTNGATSASMYSGNGGGVYCYAGNVVLTNCILVGNYAAAGGGAYQGTLYNCRLADNSAVFEGGGAMRSTLNNCILIGNRANVSGGGAGAATLNNCAVTGNSACAFGGGTTSATLNNCTLTCNSALFYGGGADGGTLNNCIVYSNAAPVGSNYYDGPTFNYCCTAPLPSGAGNTNVDPQLASAAHLSAASPCRGAGSAVYATGVDIDGEAWANPPSIGCDEYVSGAVTGALHTAIWASATNTVPSVALTFAALTEGRTSAAQLDFGDGTVTTNAGVASHSWGALGDYPVVLTSYNDTYLSGVTATVTVHVAEQVIHYVSANSPAPVPPYTSWATAARNIQDAVDSVFSAPNAEVVVSNGLYQAVVRATVYVGGRPTNQVVYVGQPITVRSVNGPAVTLLVGQPQVRCAYLTNGPVLSGFTLTNGSASGYGGGVWGLPYFGAMIRPVVTNCTLIGNSAGTYGGGAEFCTLENCTLTANSATYNGGGADYSTLNNCTLTANSAGQNGGGAASSAVNNSLVISNSATYDGGGASSCTLNNCVLVANRVTAMGSYSYAGGGASGGTLSNCTVVGNTASHGGGAYSATLNNCIIYYNTASGGGHNDTNLSTCALSYCCTTPLAGVGYITNAPLFVDLANNDLRLQSNSPCVNAGLNDYAPGPTDLDGNPRIVGGTVDIGAYECQAPALLDYYLWLQSYGLPTEASAVYADADRDGLNNWQEWMAGTNPTNAASVLLLAAPTAGPGGLTLTWLSVTNRTYYVERATDLAAQPAFSVLLSNVPGLPGTTSCMDTNPPVTGPAYYRVGVQP